LIRILPRGLLAFPTGTDETPDASHGALRDPVL
jgi:hypothetical protein